MNTSPIPHLSQSQRHERGHRHRKEVPPVELGRWQATLRRRNPLKVIDQAMKGRIPELLKLKAERMALSPFSFFRGAAPLMAYDLSLLPRTAIVNQICGDAHIQNLGAYAGEDGRLTFDINDFDETAQAPFEWDLKRMTASIQLAGRDLKSSQRDAASYSFLTAYAELMKELAPLPVLTVARYKVHGLGKSLTVSSVLEQAERSTPLKSLDKLTVLRNGQRIFREEPPVLRRILGQERRAVLDSLPLYRQSLAPERQHLLDQFRVLDVGFKVVGTGSVGLRDYCVLLQGRSLDDPLFLQVKQETASAYAPYLPASKRSTPHQGQRVVNGQRAMQFQSDPMLGWTSMGSLQFVLRQLNDHKATLDATQMDAEGLADYAQVCGRMLAHGHARSGDANLIAGYIGKGRSFNEAILNFARAYAKQTVADWKAFKSPRK